MVEFNLYKEPTAVYDLEEGDRRAIIALLRSDKPINKWTRAALADWLEGKKVQKKKRGRPRKDLLFMSIAEYRYEKISAYMRKRKCLYGNAEDLKIAVAKKYGVSPDKFINHLSRYKKHR